MTTDPIADYALLSDRHSAALVIRDGTVGWLCFPRFDSPSVFASILDDDGGHWVIQPVGDWTSQRDYVDRSMALCTTFTTPTGVLEVVDAMALGDSVDPHRLGEHAPHLLIRAVRCLSGRVRVRVGFRPRPEYGLVVPWLTKTSGGILARGGAERLTLSTPVPLEFSDDEAGAVFELAVGERRYFALHRSALGEPDARVWSQHDLAGALAHTIAGWQHWSQVHQGYQGPWCELVHHSGRVLHALSYQPTGAIVAAATTSLPEQVGGERNWDYRYSWVRDASLTMQALWVAACPDEAEDFFSFMATAAASYRPEQTLQIMFGVGGEHDLTERELPHLAGWRGSRPVRVGNGAWNQPQLDVYGELLDAAHQLREQLGEINGPTREFLVALADAAARHWQLPDNGIWEIRGQPRHFLHSKLMCWVALDRAIGMADWLGAKHRVPDWSDSARQIRQAILDRGWNIHTGAFTQSFGSPQLDASALMVPLVGFLPPTDPWVLATIDAISDQLTDERGLVYRYRSDDGVDGLAGTEGTFLLCTFWLAQALAMAGRTAQAREVFRRAVCYANDVGLLAEEIDPSTGEQLGNFPQAFSHSGLVNAAWAIHNSEQM